MAEQGLAVMNLADIAGTAPEEPLSSTVFRLATSSSDERTTWQPGKIHITTIVIVGACVVVARTDVPAITWHTAVSGVNQDIVLQKDDGSTNNFLSVDVEADVDDGAIVYVSKTFTSVAIVQFLWKLRG